MNGPRGSFVIALLILIAAEIAWVGSAITGSGSWLGGLLFLCFVVALVRVFVELFREGANSAPAPAKKRRREESTAGATALDPKKQRRSQS